jgi:hypothetical protein
VRIIAIVTGRVVRVTGVKGGSPLLPPRLGLVARWRGPFSQQLIKLFDFASIPISALLRPVDQKPGHFWALSSYHLT